MVWNLRSHTDVPQPLKCPIHSFSAFLAKRAQPEDKVAAELSGGIDSSFVALAAFRAWQGRGISLGIDIGFGRERASQLDAITMDRIGDISDKRNPYSPVLSVVYAAEKFIRWNLT